VARLMSFAWRVSSYNRRRKWRIFMDTVRPDADMTVLDVGYNELEHSATDNFIEKHYPWRSQITALGIDEPVQFAQRYPDVKAVHYEGTTFPFADRSFDVCWSNAVIEHVGRHADRWGAQVLFLKEIARVAKTGFVTTPNKRFPVEVHTRTPLLHWLPKRMFDAYLRRRGKEWAAGDYMDLLTLADLRRLLRDAGIAEYRIVRNRLLGLTLDFVVIFGERAGGRGPRASQMDAD
jgi:hypothetical protein